MTPPSKALPRIKRILLIASILAVGGLLIGIGGVGLVFWTYGRDVRALDNEAFRHYRPPQVTRVLARDGTLIGEIFSQRRTLVRHEQIPAHVENAFLAAEDADFYRHAGLDYMGMVRALIANLREGGIRQGASTITQQVVKNFVLSPERTFERKVQELVLARRLEQLLTKQEILELYLNDIFFGHARYGVEEASRFYFGRSVAEIDLGQAAVLASLPKAPSKGSPLKNPDRAKARQVYVLGQMREHGFASAEDVQRAIDAPLRLAEGEPGTRLARGADEFLDLAKSVLEDKYGAEQLDRLGGTVTTTVDLELQAASREAVREGLRGVERRGKVVRGIKPASQARRERVLGKVDGAVAKGRVYKAVIQTAPKELPADGFAARVGNHDVFVSVPVASRHRSPETSLAEQFPVHGITQVEISGSDAAAKLGVPDGWMAGVLPVGPEGVVMVADVSTGEVLAMVGGYDYRRGQFNRALRARRQPGSAFKPFVYGAALASQEYTAATLVSDSPEIYEKWRPTNFERDEYRGDIRVREAIIHSVNTVAIKLLDSVGADAVQAFAQAAGIRSELADNLSLALGTSELTPVELLTGYMTVARRGSSIVPLFIREVKAPGMPTWTPTRTAEQTIDPNVAFVLTSLMTSVVEQGTGRGAKKLGRPTAGKTGTASDYRDAWFAGFTRDHVSVAWIGFDTPKRIGPKETGGRAALPVWLGAMTVAEAGRDAKTFTPPPTVEIRTIDAKTGLLAPSGSLDAGSELKTLEEFFLPGTAPTRTAIPDAVAPEDLVLDLYADPADPAQPADG